MPELLWHNLKSHELQALSEQDSIVIVPVGSTEQHGPHLPVQVDALLASEVACRAAELISDVEPVVVTPTVWCGLAEHHMAFGGTITLDFATFHALLRCVCNSILRHGFQRVFLLNGHGGNIAALGVIATELTQELQARVVVGSYWTIPEVAQNFGEILERQQNVRHACEVETSMLLALRPELVDQSALVSSDGPMEVPFLDRGAYRWQSFKELSENGVIGAPSAASAEKGRRLLDAAADGVCKLLTKSSTWGG